VVDQTGAAVSGALITVGNISTGNTRTVLGDDAGNFQLRRLRKGIYLVSVSSPGFQPSEQTLKLEASDRATLNARLKIAFETETVEVTGQSVILVSTNTSFVGGTAGGVMGGGPGVCLG